MGINALDAALSGLRASQQQISVISNNVSNVSTPGFTRKILPQQSQSIEGVTVGVLTGTITRNVDMSLQRDLWTQISAVGELEVRQTYLSRIEEFHGAPDAELSVAAEMARLKDSFSALADTPDDNFLLKDAVNQAVDMAGKINDLGQLIMTSRNDAQADMSSTVNRINQLLEQIAELNNQVQDNLNIGRTTAASEDKRDEAIKELSQLIDLSSFKRGDGVLVVQTNTGVQLADTKAQKVLFNPQPLGAITYYPDSAAGVYVVNQNFTGNPEDNPIAINITERDIGGRLGGLIELRDQDFPMQLAQLDEVAHKLALRFEAQGLRLFTDSTGVVPLDSAPDPTTDPPTPVSYVGFSLEIRVNQAILNDNSLLREGTYGATIEPGSNEVIRRVLEFTFGATNYQIAANTDTATQVDLVNTGGASLQDWLGLFSNNTATGVRDLSTFLDVPTLVASANGALDDPNDQFTITFSDPDYVPAAATTAVTIDLSTIVSGGTSAIDDIITEINNQITLAGVDARFNASASIGPSGQIRIDSRSDIAFDASGANGMGADGLAFLGLSENSYTATDPYFDVQVGNNASVRVTLDPGDTGADLLAKFQAVPGLAARFNGDVLELRPGNDDTFASPEFGGDIKITGGPFTTSGASYGAPPASTTRTSIDNGVNIVSALFGSYSINAGVISNASPITSVAYGSETNASLTPPIPTLAFRNNNLGPGANISIDLIGSRALIDFVQKMVNQQSQQLASMDNALTDETGLRDVLQTQLSSESGVNLDEELSNLIVYQTAFAAAARVVNAVDELFQELLNAV